MKLTVAIALSSIVLAGIAEAQSSGSQQPNALFIAVDDLNSCPDVMHGETTVYTPNINALAKTGLLFSNAHCAAPACNPSRTSVMTGVAPSTSGVYLNSQDWRENKTLKDWVTLPHQFRNNGYKTMGGGKIYPAATLSQKGYTGFMDPRPWDEYFPSKERQMPQEVLPEQVPTNTHQDFCGGRFDWAELDIEPDEMADAKIVDWASQQLSETHDKPLFLAVGIYRPHIPWYTPKCYFDKHPTDQRLEAFRNGAEDPALVALYFQFGRYLLISSSRPGSMAVNLWGKWVNSLDPAYNADYHININIQMNYWLAEMCNLAECHEPLIDLTDNLRPRGRVTAKETYGCRGFVAHHATDAWYYTVAIGKPPYGMWAMAPTMDTQLIHDVFTNCIEASNVLEIDEPFRRQLEALRSRLMPMRIGEDGRLLEWEKPFTEHNKGMGTCLATVIPG